MNLSETYSSKQSTEISDKQESQNPFSIILVDAVRYEGKFDIQIQGQGQLVLKNGIVISGYWENKHRCKGIMYHNDSTYYKGDIVNKMKHGFGQLYDSENNLMYEGHFCDDKKHGKGKEFRNKEIYYVDYNLDKLNRSTKGNLGSFNKLNLPVSIKNDRDLRLKQDDYKFINTVFSDKIPLDNQLTQGHSLIQLGEDIGICNNSTNISIYKTKFAQLQTFKTKNVPTQIVQINQKCIASASKKENFIQLWQYDSCYLKPKLILPSSDEHWITKKLLHYKDTLYSCGQDKTLRLYDLTAQKLKTQLLGHQKTINDMCIVDTNIFASASDDQTVRVWDIREGKEINKLSNHEGNVTTLLYNPYQSHLISGDSYGGIKLWSPLTNIGISEFQNFYSINRITELNNHNFYIYNQQDQIRVHNKQTKHNFYLDIKLNKIMEILNHNNQKLYIADSSQFIHVYSIKFNNPI